MRRFVPGGGAAIFAVVALACGDADVVISVGGEVDTLAVVSIDVASGNAVLQSLTLEVGDTATLSVTAFNSEGQVIATTITWESSAPAVARISAAGVVEALTPGTTTLKATAGSTIDGTGSTVSAEIPTTVLGIVITPPPTAARGTLTLTPSSVFLTAAGQNSQLSATVIDTLGATITPPITWATSNAGVATVSGTGLVTSTGLGAASIIATTPCCTADTAVVTVQEPNASGVLDWFCDWSGQTGSSPAAYEGTNSTGACFTGVTSSAGDFLSVEAANPNHGFPAAMSNVLRIEFVDADTKTGSKMVQAHQQWPTPEVGEYVYYRFYDYNDIGPNQPLHAHWFHGGSNQTGSDYGGGLWALSSGRIAADLTYDINFGIGYQPSGSSGRGQGYFRMYSTMESRKLYRREHRIHRTDADSVRHQIRISDGVTGELLYTSANFTCITAETGGCVEHGGFATDTIGQYKAWHNGPNSLNSMEVGNNGANEAFRGLDPATPQFWYIGGMAVRVTADPDAWIGTYPVANTGEGN